MKKGKLRIGTEGMVFFYCPGCKEYHGVRTDKNYPYHWNFNGNYDKPTFSPSVLVTGTVFPTDEEADRIMKGEKIEPKKFVCHSFITDGKIRYLSDCTHELAGQTVEMKDVEEDE